MDRLLRNLRGRSGPIWVSRDLDMDRVLFSPPFPLHRSAPWPALPYGAAYPAWAAFSNVSPAGSRTDSPQIKSWEPAVLYREGELLDYRARWIEFQTGFVDQPRRAVERAQDLVETLMASRGLSWRALDDRLGEFWQENPKENLGEDRSQNVSQNVGLMWSFPLARAAALRDLRRVSLPWESTTEDLRRTMVGFHSLFEELLAIFGQT